MDRREFHRLAILTAASATILPRYASSQSTPIRIGYSISRTGTYASIAASQAGAYELWRDQQNAAGGLNVGGKGRRMIQFVEYDDQSQAPRTAQAYERLIAEDKVDALLAPCTTPLHIAAAPVIEGSGFTVIGNTYGSTQLRDRKVQSFFFVQPLPDTWGASLAEFLKKRGAKRVAVIAMQNPFTLEVRKNVISNAAGSYEIVFDQQYPGDTRDMTTIVSGMKAAGADAVVALSYPADGDLFGTTAREQGLNAPTFVVMFGPNYPSFAQKLGPWTNGIVSLGIWSRHVKWAGAESFVADFTKKVGAPPDDKDAVVVYASAQVLGQAIERAGSDKAAVREAVKSGSFDTIVGPVRFGPDNINVSRIAGLMQLQSGINELIWPEDAKTAAFAPRA